MWIAICVLVLDQSAFGIFGACILYGSDSSDDSMQHGGCVFTTWDPTIYTALRGVVCMFVDMLAIFLG